MRAYVRLMEFDPGLRGGDEEGNGCAAGRALTAQSKRGRDYAAGAKRQRNPDHRGPEHRLYLAGAEEPGEKALGDEDGKRPGDQEAEQQEDGRLLQDLPDFEQDLEQNVDHAEPLKESAG